MIGESKGVCLPNQVLVAHGAVGSEVSMRTTRVSLWTSLYGFLTIQLLFNIIILRLLYRIHLAQQSAARA